MKVCTISIGNELLNGQTTDTNASWLAGRLFEMGIPTVGGWTIPDEINRVLDALHTAAKQADIILVTGGLGPTDDDLTRQAVADYLGFELEFHPEILNQLEDFFAKRGRVMAETNRCQAFIPAGCEILDNPIGTAPGFWCQKEKAVIAVMPGVPVEMKRMFDEQVVHRIRSIHTGAVIAGGKVRCFGPGESTLAQKLGDLMDRGRNPLINCTCGSGEILVHIIAQAENRKTAEVMIDEDKKMLSALLGDWVYGYNDRSLPESVGDLLRKTSRTIATAESCTGGIIAKMITDVPGASDCFNYGWVTYSNDAKVDQLGVGPVLINEHGAVSEAVAEAMAIGARQKSGADLAVAVTGIAGPGGGSEQKPVGLVYIAVSSKNGCETRNFHFTRNDRDFIRTRTAQTALDMLRAML